MQDYDDTQERIAKNPWIGRHFFEMMVALWIVFGIAALVAYSFNDGL